MSKARDTFKEQRKRKNAERRAKNVCKNKIAYISEAKAKIKCDQMNTNKYTKSVYYLLQPYQCPICDLWHIYRVFRNANRL